jgi:hypothetical protein
MSGCLITIFIYAVAEALIRSQPRQRRRLMAAGVSLANRRPQTYISCPEITSSIYKPQRRKPPTQDIGPQLLTLKPFITARFLPLKASCPEAGMTWSSTLMKKYVSLSAFKLFLHNQPNILPRAIWVIQTSKKTSNSTRQTSTPTPPLPIAKHPQDHPVSHCPRPAAVGPRNAFFGHYPSMHNFLTLTRALYYLDVGQLYSPERIS